MTTHSAPASTSGTDPGKRSIGKVVFASLIGTATEWYDFFLFGSAAALDEQRAAQGFLPVGGHDRGPRDATVVRVARAPRVLAEKKGEGLLALPRLIGRRIEDHLDGGQRHDAGESRGEGGGGRRGGGEPRERGGHGRIVGEGGGERD